MTAAQDAVARARVAWEARGKAVSSPAVAPAPVVVRDARKVVVSLPKKGADACPSCVDGVCQEGVERRSSCVSWVQFFGPQCVVHYRLQTVVVRIALLRDWEVRYSRKFADRVRNNAEAQGGL
jgi:hypothetical protein